MHVIIHAGLPKTGSTAVQEYLALNRASFARVGVLYPELGHRSHWLLAAALSDDPAAYHQTVRRLTPEQVDQETGRALERVREVLAGAGRDDVVLLSHESFAAEERLSRLDAFVNEASPPGTKITYVAYARPPVDHYPSGLQNALRSIRDAFSPPSSWNSQHPDRGLAMKTRFGDHALVRPYVRRMLVDGDVITDLKSVIGAITGKVLPSHQVGTVSNNTSLSADACALLYTLRTHPDRPSLPVLALLRRKLARYDQGEVRNKLKIPDSWKRAIEHRNQDRWNRLVDQMDVDPATCVELRYHAEPASERVNGAAAHDFLIGQLTSAYCIDYAQALTRGPSKDRTASDEAALWLKTVGSSVPRDGFEPATTFFRAGRAQEKASGASANNRTGNRLRRE